MTQCFRGNLLKNFACRLNSALGECSVCAESLLTNRIFNLHLSGLQFRSAGSILTRRNRLRERLCWHLARGLVEKTHRLYCVNPLDGIKQVPPRTEHWSHIKHNQLLCNSAEHRTTRYRCSQGPGWNQRTVEDLYGYGDHLQLHCTGLKNPHTF